MTPTLTLALVLAVLIGVSLGTLGSGGSIITMPVLVYVAGVPADRAVAMSLVIVGTTAALGSYLQSRATGIDTRAAIIFAATGMIGAFFGATLTHLLPGDSLMLLFAVLMMAAGAGLRRPGAAAGPGGPCRMVRCLPAGAALGVLTGFLGVGGGFLIVPALVLFAGLDMKRAVPTSLAIIAFNSAGGLAGQLRAVDIDGPLTMAFLVSAVTGMTGGTALAARLSADQLRRAFAWAIILLGAATCIRAALRLGGAI